MLTGSLQRIISAARAKASAISFSGVATGSKIISAAYAGALSFTGALAWMLSAVRTYAGTISISGTLSRLVSAARAVTGAISFSGIATGVQNLPGEVFTAGVIAITGALSRTVSLLRSAAGTLSFTGALARVVKAIRATVGGLSFSGTVSGVFSDPYAYAKDGAISFVGALLRVLRASRTKAGTLSFTGTATGAEAAGTGTDQDGLADPPGIAPIAGANRISRSWLDWFAEAKKWSRRVNVIRNDAVSDPPTAAQLTSAFGSPEALGDGFNGIIDANGTGSRVYFCWVRGTEWHYTKGTKAV